MLIYYIIALIAAFCWSVSSLISADVSRELGGIGFNRLRLILVSIMLLIFTFFDNNWVTIKHEYIAIILISGIIGVLIGDTLLFIALQRIGPRRNNILFALAAPFTIILNIFILKENMNLLEFLGCIVVFIGVVLAITYGSNKKNEHRWEIIEGSIIYGIILGVLAALCQAIGIIMMKPILNNGADPIVSAALRTSVSALILSLSFLTNYKLFKDKTKYTFKIFYKTTIAGFMGMALGMSLLLISLKYADAGIVATLSSTSPIIILFLIWLITKKIPTFGAWLGTIFAIAGTGMIFIN
ncbi:MAG: hypothetical protein CFH19_00497 [Alphaproteobacteria bacterium MarineAlpha5_Bin9]|nr:MAG: hypothetical protein CFH19_00497 [Alphaproteobacteria bacterium MarineAlpha5_Bin9]|tara:strand:+ start:6775 stop:7668 length:894 start_codon:yes stop_codon:yes gene_type:complete